MYNSFTLNKLYQRNKYFKKGMNQARDAITEEERKWNGNYETVPDRKNEKNLIVIYKGRISFPL